MSAPNTQPAAEATPALGRLRLSRLNLTLLAILVVQIGLIAYTFWPAPTAASGQPLLADITADQIEAIEIASSDNTSVKLEKSADGWVLAGTDGFPADDDKIASVLDKLFAIGGGRPVTQTPASHKRLQVSGDDFARRVALTTASGETVLYLGSTAGAGAVHIRLSGDDAAYLTNEIAAWELPSRPGDWINTVYFSASADEMQRIALQNQEGELTFVRDDAGAWTLADLAEDETADSTAIQSLAGRLAAVSMTRPLGKEALAEYGMDAPLATVTIDMKPENDTENDTENSTETGEETTVTLTVGAKRADGGYVIKSSDSEYFVAIAAYLGDQLSGAVRDDYLAEPEPTPTAAPSEETGESGEESAPAAEDEAAQSPVQADSTPEATAESAEEPAQEQATATPTPQP